MGGDAIIWGVDAIARETVLIAAIGFLIGGIDDLLIDLSYIGLRVRAWWRGAAPTAFGDETPQIAVFIPAWDEAQVIAPMLAATLARYDYPAYHLYVGTYANDHATAAAVAEVSGGDPRVRLVISDAPGPTTKADCLNTLWRALLADEAAGEPVAAVVLHDAEDLVHPAELRLLAAHLTTHDAVQLPVVPLPDPLSPLVAGHYLDEFAEAHAKALVVRQAAGAALPFAGVGCAISCDMLKRIAAAKGGLPFDATSLTEDYELGLTVAALGGRSCFVRQRDAAGQLIATRAYFPGDLGAAIRQKSRWMTGIALAGWDRTGWGAARGWGENWMRMRDRRATLAIPVLGIAYVALIAWAASALLHWLSGQPLTMPEGLLAVILQINLVLLAWRLVLRMAFTGREHGVVEALLALPRVLVANYIALLAARRALVTYWPTLRGAAPRWDKTSHHFPEVAL